MPHPGKVLAAPDKFSAVDTEHVPRGLGVRDVDCPVPSMIKNTGIDELELGFVARASAVLIYQPLIRKGSCG